MSHDPSGREAGLPRLLSPGSVYCVIAPGTDPETLARAIDDSFTAEFFIDPRSAEGFDPSEVSRWMDSGFLPFSLRMMGVPHFSPKYHRVRAIADPGKVAISRTVRRLSRRFSIRVDGDFAAVAGRCVTMHGDDWLCAELVASFVSIHRNPPGRSSMRSFEVLADGDAVAGEIGYSCGRRYTSLSGYTAVSGAGSVQLAATARWLEHAGFGPWDLGMPLPYKTRLGAIDLPRSGYNPLFSEAHASPCPSPPEERVFAAIELIGS